MSSRPALVSALLAACVALPGVAPARVLVTEARALAEAFPGAELSARQAILDDAQAARAEALAGAPLPSRIVSWHEATRDGVPAGTAFVDVHLVRTLPEALLVVVGPDATVRRIEVLAFSEPTEYQPPERWLAQFNGRALDDELRLRRGVRALGGATLSGRAVTAAVRRALALHAVLVAPPLVSAPAPAEPPAPASPPASRQTR